MKKHNNFQCEIDFVLKSGKYLKKWKNTKNLLLLRPIHVSQTQIQLVPPPAFLHLVVPEVRDRPHFLLRPVPSFLQPQVPRLVCVCELANVRDLHDRESFDVFPCSVYSNVRTR